MKYLIVYPILRPITNLYCPYTDLYCYFEDPYCP